MTLEQVDERDRPVNAGDLDRAVELATVLGDLRLAAADLSPAATSVIVFGPSLAPSEP